MNICLLDNSKTPYNHNSLDNENIRGAERSLINLALKLNKLGQKFGIPYWDADDVRRIYSDWEFTPQGRERQALRMRKLAENDRISICGFVCPLLGHRRHFFPDKTIWMDTISEGRFEDTNKIFEKPKSVDFHITEWNDKNHINIAHDIKEKYV